MTLSAPSVLKFEVKVLELDRSNDLVAYIGLTHSSNAAKINQKCNFWNEEKKAYYRTWSGIADGDGQQIGQGVENWG